MVTGGPAAADPLAAAPVLRTFSFGRSALLAGLHLSGVGAGAGVLLPGYICAEVLAPLAACGATPLFYEVNAALSPAAPWQAWPAARVVLAVNYFGFPQALDPFRAYCAHHGAVLIEDNAHGWMSRDAEGAWLGLRGDLGLFSLRKSLRLPDGAALAVMRQDLAASAPAQLPPHQTRTPLGLQIERALAGLPSPLPLAWARSLRRTWRRWRTGSALPAVDAAAERHMPAQAAPHAGLAGALARVDGAAESARRRALYMRVHARLAPFGIMALWPELPTGTVPYAYAFRPAAASPADLAAAVKTVQGMGLDAFVWPALPSALAGRAPRHYTDVWLVNLL